jgi:AraC-like DNA-binding protein
MLVSMSGCGPGSGVERIEARFHGNGFSPHRHDTYALGLTLHGVQTFTYRGTLRFSLPGQVIVLHPDERHDGAAGTADGLIYRMLYLPPHLVGAAADHREPLPFVADPVVTDPVLRRALADLLDDLNHAPDGLMMDDAVMRIAARLRLRSSKAARPVAHPARAAVLLARDYLESRCFDTVRSEEIEAAAGLDRYELARQFRRLLGTSPYRYLIMRRLDHAKRMLLGGQTLADVAAHIGFADQAHFTRHFRHAFGMPPGRWVAMRQA